MLLATSHMVVSPAFQKLSALTSINHCLGANFPQIILNDLTLFLALECVWKKTTKLGILLYWAI